MLHPYFSSYQTFLFWHVIALSLAAICVIAPNTQPNSPAEAIHAMKAGVPKLHNIGHDGNYSYFLPD